MKIEKYIKIAAIGWVIITILLYIIHKIGGLSLMGVVDISASLAWILVAIFLVWVFATDGKAAWISTRSKLGRIVIRTILLFEAACAIALMVAMLVAIIDLIKI